MVAGRKEKEVGITFVIPGPPKGKARARTFYNPKLKRMQSITPDGTVLYENLIKTSYIEAATEEAFKGYFDKEPLSVAITAVYDIPKSAGKKKTAMMQEGIQRPCKKPDIDNIAKVVCDALNKAAYGDDTQICDMYLRKRYTREGESPQVIVTISGAD